MLGQADPFSCSCVSRQCLNQQLLAHLSLLELQMAAVAVCTEGAEAGHAAQLQEPGAGAGARQLLMPKTAPLRPTMSCTQTCGMSSQMSMSQSGT